MKTKTKKDRLKVYKTLLRLAIEDRELTKKLNALLCGYCYLCSMIKVKLEDLPELMVYKPKIFFYKTEFSNGYWFDCNKENLQRIAILEQIIEDMKGDKHESN